MVSTQHVDDGASHAAWQQDASASATLVLPMNLSLARVAFARSGDDLVVVGPDGARGLFRGFFRLSARPDVLDSAGARFAGRYVAALAGAPEAGSKGQ